MSDAKIVVTGKDLGEFLAFYFDDPGLIKVRRKWEQPVFEGDRLIDLPEFMETATRFEVNVVLRGAGEGMD